MARFYIFLIVLFLSCTPEDVCLECFERTLTNAHDVTITDHLLFEFENNRTIGIKCSQDRQRLTAKYGNPAEPIIEIDPVTGVRTLVTVICR